LPAASLPSASAPAAYASAAPDWIVSVGLEGRALPAWAGASDSKLAATALPLFSVRTDGSPPPYFGPRDSVGFSLLSFNGFAVGPALRFIDDRQAQNSKELYGLGSVSYAVQVGGFAEYWSVPWLRLRGEVRQGIGGETGVTGDVFLDAVVPFGRWVWSAGPRMTLQSTAAVSPYFSISPAQAAATVLVTPTTGLAPVPAYNASGGFYSYGAGTKVQYTFNAQWSAHSFVEYERLTGSVADSPIVTQRGSADQVTFGLGATYAFAMHPWW
jgi:MipA family protein